MKNVFLIVLVLLTVLFPDKGHAVHVINDDSVAGAWAYWGGQPDELVPDGADYQDFIISGGAGKAARGTFDDEYGLVAVIGTNHITKNGAQFCTVQVQCANERNNKLAWTTYHFPSGGKVGDHLKCYTMCKQGYTAQGDECVHVDDLAKFECNSKDPKRYLVDGIGMSHSGGTIESYISALYSWYYGDNEYDVVLGVVKFVEHGAFVAPVGLFCGRDNWKDNDSFIRVVRARVQAGKETLVCMPGYTPEAGDSPQKCVLIDQDKCDISKLTSCAGVDDTKFDDKVHVWKLPAEGLCKTFVCGQEGYAFKSSTDTTCSLCGDGTSRFGIDDSGVCVSCEKGSLFDDSSKKCATAVALSKVELQYGKGKTKNSENNTFKNQCWAYTIPDEYKNCINGCEAGTTFNNGKCQTVKTGDDSE